MQAVGLHDVSGNLRGVYWELQAGERQVWKV